jgi:hypothetical protein
MGPMPYGVGRDRLPPVGAAPLDLDRRPSW